MGSNPIIGTLENAISRVKIVRIHDFFGHAPSRTKTHDTAGNITEFATAFDPDRITAGPDENLWFTEPFNDKIGRITPTGVITEFALSAPVQLRDIVAGPDGNLWFTEYIAGMLARITPDGVVTKVQPLQGGPWRIGRGVGDTIWLTQFDENRVARFRTGPGRMLFRK